MTEEPYISVGIMSARVIRFALNETYLFNGQRVGSSVWSVYGSLVSMKWNDEFYTEMLFEPENGETGTFSLYDVTIGSEFHWQRKEKQTFHGALKFVYYNEMVYAINVLPVEEYLRSVVSSEMSPHASLEFLKAHAVISRSWLMAQINRKVQEGYRRRNATVNGKPARSKRGLEYVIKWYDHDDHTLFDVCADDHCQRYQGLRRISNPRATDAVNQTRGEVLMYEGEICDARFSKCCGGIMEEYSACWEDSSKPYLVAKPDMIEDERARGVDEAFCNTGDDQILSQVLNSYDRETTDFYRWEVAYSGREIDCIVREKSGIDFGHILELNPIRRGASGRIVELEIRGTKRTVVVGKELEIRRWLSTSHLYSSAFEVEKLEDGFLLSGRGWGHGVGLCQIGAAVMGERGFGYREILQHYYPGADIQNVETLRHESIDTTSI